MNKTYKNPIIPGFHPDPSICRVEEDYYLITSTFEYFPGLPIFHSRDLVHWKQIGHVLDRPSQLPLDGVRPSGGLYAPTIRYHNGTFYVINTLVDGKKERGNFIVTATDPAGPWSEPYWLKDAPGIDPSLLFEEVDGKTQAWYVGNHHEFEGHYQGHCYIWLQELDLETMQLTGPKTRIWDGGAVKGAVYAEAPHLYKINGWYYLMIAEGGTGHQHAVTIARSKTITGPYEIYNRNPILTHRHLGLTHPIVGTGHADLVETQNGEWWMVCLAMRPFNSAQGRPTGYPEGEPNEGYFYNLGRETFLTPVIWEEDWPVVSPGIGRVLFEHPIPDLPEHQWPVKPVCDHFEAKTLDYVWNFLRTPYEDFYSLTERPGYLRLKLRPQKLSEWVNPSFVGRRQQHINFMAQTAMEFTPKAPSEEAGLVLLQNNDFHFRLTVTGVETPRRGVSTKACLVKREQGKETTLAKFPISTERVYFKVEAYGQAYSFYIAEKPGAWQVVAKNVDGRILSTSVAGGFVGAYIGLYASSNGETSDTVADFDWFEYQEI